MESPSLQYNQGHLQKITNSYYPSFDTDKFVQKVNLKINFVKVENSHVLYFELT